MRRILGYLLPLMLGCGAAAVEADGGTSSSGGSVGARVELGTGSATFEPLADGRALELIQGPQGGWHIELTNRFWGLDPDGLMLSYAIMLPGQTEPISFPSRIQLTQDRVVRQGDGWMRPGDRAVFNIMAPAEVVGGEFVVSVTLEAQDGSTVEDQRRITVVDSLP